MVVESVRVHMLSSQHVVILKQSDRDRYLPIWIGPSEANAIAMRLQGLNAERPLTHDLLVSIVGTLNASVNRGVGTSVAEGAHAPDEKLAVFREFINSLDVDLGGGEKGPPREELGG